MRLLMRAGAWLVIGGVVALAGWGLGEYEARAKSMSTGETAQARNGVERDAG